MSKLNYYKSKGILNIIILIKLKKNISHHQKPVVCEYVKKIILAFTMHYNTVMSCNKITSVQ